MLRSVALVRTVVSEETSTSIIRVTRIGALGTTLPLTSNRCKLRRSITSQRSRFCVLQNCSGAQEPSDKMDTTGLYPQDQSGSSMTLTSHRQF
jgi:hypothetical protein